MAPLFSDQKQAEDHVNATQEQPGISWDAGLDS